MTYEMEKQYQANKVKHPPEVSRRAALIGAGVILLVGLVVGTILGASLGSGAQGGAQPQPVKTVEVEVPSAVVVGSCGQVAEELFSILQSMNADVALPQNQVIQMFSSAGGFPSASEIREMTEILDGVTATTKALTDRVDTLTPDYQRCINP